MLVCLRLADNWADADSIHQPLVGDDNLCDPPADLQRQVPLQHHLCACHDNAVPSDVEAAAACHTRKQRN